jgi:alcohol dehydrogenase class IV
VEELRVADAIDDPVRSRQVNDIGAIVRGFCRRRLIVTTVPEPWHQSLVDHVIASLAASGVESHWFSDVGRNPTTDQINAGAAAAREFRADVAPLRGFRSAV